jgi:GNAT superfamily N-acetyltransferase
MSPVKSAGQVLETIQQVKAGAKSFCTNFFPVNAKLDAWIEHGELLVAQRAGAAFFIRKDRDFGHLFFCAASPEALERELPGVAHGQGGTLSTDVIGAESSLTPLLDLLGRAGFCRHSHLMRLARTATPPAAEAGDSITATSGDIAFAEASDALAILHLLESLFDVYADQLPVLYELENAIAARQIMLIKREGTLAAFLHFETQGFTSTVRYWVVAPRFQSQRLGGSLLRHYFATHRGVRRFILWVTATNDNAVQKYRHYGYAPDGLVDHVLLLKN